MCGNVDKNINLNPVKAIKILFHANFSNNLILNHDLSVKTIFLKRELKINLFRIVSMKT